MGLGGRLDGVRSGTVRSALSLAAPALAAPAGAVDRAFCYEASVNPPLVDTSRPSLTRARTSSSTAAFRPPTLVAMAFAERGMGLKRTVSRMAAWRGLIPEDRPSRPRTLVPEVGTGPGSRAAGTGWEPVPEGGPGRASVAATNGRVGVDLAAVEIVGGLVVCTGLAVDLAGTRTQQLAPHSQRLGEGGRVRQQSWQIASVIPEATMRCANV
jgi:hypothetical protein